MHLTCLLPFLLSSLSLTSAAALDRRAKYTVTNYSHGDPLSRYTYHFNVSAPQSDPAPGFHVPGFDTFCRGDSEDTTPCDLKNITVAIAQLEHEEWNVKIQHKWSSILEGESSFRFDMESASKNVTDQASTFVLEVDPNSAKGVSKRHH